ncbi:UDP-glucose 4-epimerase GalE [Aeoliella sp. SH292]|uniref:UDP-glucose 4-epimerase GalE n=1 Tax=Aeoliella sp. SH292 TaxID=3454464 RepID=UPI003F98FCFF
MKVLVVGGAGYIGSHAVRALEDAGHEAWVFDNLYQGHTRAVPKGRLIVGDLLERSDIDEALDQSGAEAVMHFAALALVGESVTDPAKYYANNVVGTLNLLDAMRARDIWKFVFSSTCATYGVPDKVPIDETEKQLPINPYGDTKLAIEKALEAYSHAYGFGVAALRYFNAAGSHHSGEIGEDHDPESHLIPIILQVALGQRERVTVYGDDYPTPDGTCIRDYIHVEDLSDAHVAALERLKRGEMMKLNLGTGNGFSVKEVIDACRKVTGHEIPTAIGERRPGDPAELVANSAKAFETLDWKPKYTSVDQVVESAWRWHKAHPNGYEDK